ncbi:fibronectin type III domain-containing protein [Trujillonella humicola]|uniref:fibronectin type III domain-containing protein n=1 Tax=Trujillonella humicola TaxID=3383699 RepID=UPI003906344F
MHESLRSPARRRASIASVALAGALAGTLAAAPAAVAAPDGIGGTVVAAPGLDALPVTVPAGHCAVTLDLVSGAGDDPAAQRAVFGAVDVRPGEELQLAPGLTGSPTGAPSEVMASGDPLLSTAGPDATQPYAAEDQGRISYEFVPCKEPRSPNLQSVTPAGPDALALRFLPSPHEPGSGLDRVTGYEASTDGGGTWAPLPTRQEDGDTALHATVTGLPRAAYAVGVRAVSATGPSPVDGAHFLAASLLLDLGTPTGVTATAGTSSVGVAWSPPADAAGITGYRVEATPAGGGTRALCEVAATVHGCRIGVAPGRSYDVVVSSVGPAGEYATVPAAAVTTGVVPAPAVPAAVPPASGPLDAPGSAVPGGALAVRGAGFLPHSTVTLVVYSAPTVLGTLVADATGAVAGTVALPAGLAPGVHTLVAVGVDPAGDPHHLVSAVTVAGTAPAAVAGPGPGPALAVTGAEVAGPAAAGVGALVLGGVLTLAGRRRATS